MSSSDKSSGQGPRGLSPKFILLNGPPRSGKDTAANIIMGMRMPINILRNHEKFSAPLKQAFAGMMEVDCDMDYIVEDYEARKEEVIPSLGISFRQWQIDFSEKFMKPLYGNDIFGRLFMHRLEFEMDPKDQWVFVVSDCGFQVEVDHLRKVYPAENILTIRLIREGCSFDGDSRSYISGGPTMIDLDNNQSLPVFEADLKKIITEFLFS